MLRTARHLSSDLGNEIDSHLTGSGWALVLVAFLAVAREGIETALFLWAAAQASGSTTLPLLGAFLGILTAVVLGYLIYRGVLKIDLGRFFAYTGAFLIVIAGGVLANGVHELQEAGLIPGISSLAYDVRAAVPGGSWYGTLLKGIFNFSPAATTVEVAVWLSYVVLVLTFFLRMVRTQRPATPTN
jgi:high-affinity iron transporter